MAEYVNKENLIRHIDNRFGEISTPFVLREIKNFPNADVVEVVRCKDCRHFSQGMAVGICYRVKDKPLIPCCYDHFCSYGEKREEGTE